MNSLRFLGYLVLIGLFLSALAGCRHEPFMMAEDDDFMPIDTTVVDTTTVDTMGTDTVGVPCDSTKIYFERQILPILRSSCAFSGCHDATSAQDGVILDNYDDVIRTGDVRPFDLSGTDLYEVLVDEDEDDRMPPAPRSRLPASQINRIATWILEGAENLSCDVTNQGCQTTDVSFSAVVKPIIETNCQGCHSGGSPSGGIDLASYSGIKTRADNGQLLGSIDWQDGFSRMPQGSPQLDQCKIDQIAAWIADGALEN
ncbi:c-type cytochrome [Neolewinella agarilytica]|uniref:Planctomycete cytochrome C n=1 Tax=Neolewinella agarilytica TaxID=478744 RepID=A0A1H9H3L4_9BACT|nr:c-type cytochrome [Neolewinella agarilytica]SEQ56954.1 Planctomycete cytochrome C [Neolewinella agarilytica]